MCALGQFYLPEITSAAVDYCACYGIDQLVKYFLQYVHPAAHI